MNLRKKVKPDQIYSEFVNIMNGVLRLPKRAAEVFSLLVTYDSEVEGETRITPEMRSEIRQKLDMSESNLSHNIKALKDKGLVIYHDHHSYFNPTISPTINNGLLEIIFTLETDVN